MGDARYEQHFVKLREADDKAAALDALGDDEVIQALAASSLANDAYLANVLATEAMNRMRRARTLALNLAEGAFAVDRALVLTFVNPTMAEMIGSPWRELVGRSLGEVVHMREAGAASAGSDWRPVRLSIDSGNVLEWDGAIGPAGGPFVDVSAIVAPIVADDEPAGAVVAFRDVREREADRRRLEAVLEQMPAGVAIVDAATREVLFHNEEAERVLRHPIRRTSVPATADGFGAIHPDGRRYAKEEYPVSRALDKGETIRQQDVAYVRGDGTRTTLDVSAAPVRDAAGRVVAAVTAFFDVGDQRATQEALRRSESQYAALVRNSPEPMAVHAAGRLLFINRAGAQLLGADDPESLVGRNVLEFVHPNSVPLVKERVARLLAGATLLPAAEEKLVRLDGRVIDVETVGMGIRYEGRPAVQLILRDITHRKEHERELERRVAERTGELQRAIRDLETFSNSVSHDLRAPLRGLGFLLGETREALARGDAEEAQLLVDRSAREASRAQRLLGGLLSFARSGKAELHPEEVDVSALADEVAAEIAAAHPDRRTAWSVDRGIGTYGDRTLVRIALGNLMDNASKYAAHAPAPEVRVFQADGAIHVRDNGVGFPPGEVYRLFQPFARLSTATGFEGTGLGLATVHRVVERHGGRVWAQSRTGETTFSFTLGAAPGGNATARRRDDATG